MKYIEDEIMKVTKKKKKFNYLIGNKSTHLIIYNPSQILKTKKHKNTIYWYFDALIKSINGNPVIGARHTIQIPAKTLGFQLYHKLKDNNKLTHREVRLSIIKQDNFTWDITIHT